MRMISQIRTLMAVVLMLASVSVTPASTGQDKEIWVLVDTAKMTLSILVGDETKRVYENISIGRGGTTTDKRMNDQKTPLGEYRISRIKPVTPFHRFFGLDYPRLDQAWRAMETGVITERQFMHIFEARRRGEAPPQNTPLGGYLGIHGVGSGDPVVHQSFNWTNGCVALSNEQIDDLAKWLRIGTRVVVR
jgi:murein L,D-transpeptidase YafK